MEDINSLKQIIGCSTDEATHYLEIFQGNLERAACVVLEHQEDVNWWGYPWNASDDTKCLATTEEDMGDRISTADNLVCERENTEIEALAQEFHDSRSHVYSSAASEEKEDISLSVDESFTSIPIEHGIMDAESNLTNPFVTADDLSDDRCFYGHYHEIVNNFIDALCAADFTRNDLRKMISEADMTVKRDTGSEEHLSDLVNRPSFLHNTTEGRTPISYAVAKNLKQRLSDLIDLGADVSKTMTNQDDENGAPVTALVIAATNPKRDGTEMVRILLSKGANPEEIFTAGVDEKSLGLGMRYWLDKARRIGVPSQTKLAHMKKTPPMHHLHELDYAVVGEEAAVSVIQQALAGRFGNPQVRYYSI